jgi:2-polyprenyl-3-methyl-5-hydroxy-6-metoxy-1,4-benzoquinol methylase
LAVGLSATGFWLGRFDIGPEFRRNVPVLGLGLFITAALTLANVGLRWVRWHFLTRRVGARLITRESLLIYLATLPAIVTPFYVGELLRAVLIGKKYPRHRGDVAGIWLLERTSDLLVLAIFIPLVWSRVDLLAACMGVWLAVAFGFRAVYRRWRRVDFPRPSTMLVLVALTAATWVFPGAALWGMAQLLKTPLALPGALDVFAASTLSGTVTGLPLGTGVVGSSMIARLQPSLSVADAILVTLVFRMGTAWFAVALGTVVAVAYRGRLSAIIRSREGPSHFDAIAEDYEHEMPPHIRERLLGRKLRVMQRWLPTADGGSVAVRGLDVGCGQGWYACELARAGYAMCGVDVSESQIQLARRYSVKQNAAVRFEKTDGASLPFPDGHFDFAYAINVLHHVDSGVMREQLLREVVRVLKPGGVFFLHEINTANVLFRFYMDYVFPLIRAIDEGTENWISASDLPPVRGACWQAEIDYFTFIPDFVPAAVMRLLEGLERRLERSRFSNWSAHYMARLVAGGADGVS